jgi:hypothetical protein
MNAKIKKMQYQRYFLLFHSSWSRNLWTWMCDYENYFRESIALTFMNDGTMREPIVNSHFPLGIIAMTLTVPLQIRNSYFSVLEHCWSFSCQFIPLVWREGFEKLESMLQIITLFFQK